MWCIKEEDATFHYKIVPIYLLLTKPNPGNFSKSYGGYLSSSALTGLHLTDQTKTLWTINNCDGRNVLVWIYLSTLVIVRTKPEYPPLTEIFPGRYVAMSLEMDTSYVVRLSQIIFNYYILLTTKRPPFYRPPGSPRQLILRWRYWARLLASLHSTVNITTLCTTTQDTGRDKCFSSIESCLGSAVVVSVNLCLSFSLLFSKYWNVFVAETGATPPRLTLKTETNQYSNVWTCDWQYWGVTSKYIWYFHYLITFDRWDWSLMSHKRWRLSEHKPGSAWGRGTVLI